MKVKNLIKFLIAKLTNIKQHRLTNKVTPYQTTFNLAGNLLLLSITFCVLCSLITLVPACLSFFIFLRNKYMYLTMFALKGQYCHDQGRHPTGHGIDVLGDKILLAHLCSNSCPYHVGYYFQVNRVNLKLPLRFHALLIVTIRSL